MKLAVITCLVAVCQAGFLDHLLGDVKDAANTVIDGVKDAANTVGGEIGDTAHLVGGGVVDAANAVGGGVVDAANTVGHALGPVGETLGHTFGDIWNVAKDPLEQAGEQLLVQVGTFALEQGVTLALNALAAGKRDVPDVDLVKTYLTAELTDECKKWRQETEQYILGSKDELLHQLSSVTHIDSLPADMKDYLSAYRQAMTTGDVSSFINSQAAKAFENATDSLKERLKNRLYSAIENLKN